MRCPRATWPARTQSGLSLRRRGTHAAFKDVDHLSVPKLSLPWPVDVPLVGAGPGRTPGPCREGLCSVQKSKVCSLERVNLDAAVHVTSSTGHQGTNITNRAAEQGERMRRSAHPVPPSRPARTSGAMGVPQAAGEPLQRPAGQRCHPPGRAVPTSQVAARRMAPPIQYDERWETGGRSGLHFTPPGYAFLRASE